MTPILLIILLILIVILAIWVMRRRTRLPVAAVRRPPAVASPDAARQGALRGIAEYGMDRDPDWQPLVTAPAIPLEPVLVERLDKAKGRQSFYYLVPFGVDIHSVGAIAIVDGISAEFEEAKPMRPREGRSWGDMAESLRKKDTSVRPHFVWKPCAESRSPFSPFLAETKADRTQYIRLDGQVFDQLTTLGPGGRTPSDRGGRTSSGPADAPPTAR